MFSIILGYFAALAVTKENFDLSTYICKRYLRFFVVIAFTIVLIQVLIFVFASAELRNSAFIVKENFFIGKPLVSLGEILKVSLLFGEAIFPLLWCMDDFFFASLIIVVVFSNSSEKTYKIQGGGYLLLVAFVSCCAGYVWVGICCMGAIVYYLEHTFKVSSRNYIGLFLILLIVYKYMAWQWGENQVIYILQGILCSSLFLWLLHSKQEILNWRIFAKGGEISFYIYVSHILVIYTWGYYFTDFINGLIPYKAAFLITFISTVFVTWIVSWGIYIVLEKKILKKIYLLMGWN